MSTHTVEKEKNDQNLRSGRRCPLGGGLELDGPSMEVSGIPCVDSEVEFWAYFKRSLLRR